MSFLNTHGRDGAFINIAQDWIEDLFKLNSVNVSVFDWFVESVRLIYSKRFSVGHTGLLSWLAKTQAGQRQHRAI